MFRKMLEEQLRVMEDGGDPINVMRTVATQRGSRQMSRTRTGVIDEVKDLKAVPT